MNDLTLRERLQRLIHIHVWGMDIHPSAKIAPSALIDRTWPKGIHIGANTIICEQCVVLTHDFTRGLYLHTTIGARCYLGPRSIIFPGVSVGDDCVIMPGALVNKDMAANSMAIGNPARFEDRVQGGTAPPKADASRHH